MEAVHGRAAGWDLMLHGNVFLQYLWDGGERGRDQLGSINWGMGMASRPLAGGHLELRAMLSAERLTVGECGYPDLLASGESCDGEPIVDRQHPHDAVMEMAVAYERPLTDDVALQLYGGLAAEPALGPVAYPHRPSAMANLSAPVGHHWLDATHITYGSVTAGLFGRSWKLEGSVFNGREPDEDRFDLDLARLDSWSGRLTLAPDERWTVQVSAGHLEEAEVHEPGEPRVDVDRVTASLIHHRTLAGGGHWSSTLAWGRNTEGEESRSTAALLAESTLVRGAHGIFGRLEWVRKSGEDLAIHELEGEVFSLAKAGLGYQRRLGSVGSFAIAGGALVSLGILPAELRPWYGTRAAPGLGVFLRVHPGAMPMAAGEHQHTP
jgi:hypothetical protein